MSALCLMFSVVLPLSNALSATYLGYYQYHPSESNLVVTDNEISGLTWFRNNVFYAISDELNIENKGWIKYEYDLDDYSFKPLFGQILGDHPYGDTGATDSEQIAVIGLPFESGYYDDGTSNTALNILEMCYGRKGDANILYGYFLIAKEGWRPLGRDDRLLLYHMDGTFVKEFMYPSLYTMTDTTGSKNNGGFEALYISEDYNTLIISNELPLLQDECLDNAACVRISIGSLNGNTAEIINDVDVKWEYMLRYDAEGLDWEVKDVLLLDADKFNRNCDKGNRIGSWIERIRQHGRTKRMGMPALILESYAGGDEIRDFDIFLVDLDLGSNGADDILDCFSISNDCPDAKKLNKISIFGEDKTRGLPNDIGFDFKLLNFEAMAVIDNIEQDSIDYEDEDCIGERLILSNDNAETSDNFFITYLINFC